VNGESSTVSSFTNFGELAQEVLGEVMAVLVGERQSLVEEKLENGDERVEELGEVILNFG